MRTKTIILSLCMLTLLIGSLVIASLSANKEIEVSKETKSILSNSYISYKEISVKGKPAIEINVDGKILRCGAKTEQIMNSCIAMRLNLYAKQKLAEEKKVKPDTSKYGEIILK